MLAKGWDYVVIGAGAAGCVIAGRLSQMLPDARIALIEAGGERLGLTTKVPGIAFIASTFARHNWNFETEPVPALNGRRLSWFQGRILGGSSSINGMLYLRGHSLEYDQWAQRGCQGWSFDQVLPYFKKAETNTRGAGEWHGDGGPMTVKPSRLDLPICDAFLAAAGEAGYPGRRRSQRRCRRGFWPDRHQHRQRPPRQHRAGLCAAGEAARQSRSAVGGDRGTDRHREWAGEGRRDHPARRARNGLGGARSHPLRRHRQLAAAPDAVGHRAGRSSLQSRHSGRARCARGRPQSAEPPVLCAALCLLAAGHRVQIPEPAGGDRDGAALCADRRRLARRELCRDRRIHAQRPVACGLRHDRRDDPGAGDAQRRRVSPARPLPRAPRLYGHGRVRVVRSAAAISCCAAPIRRRIRGFSRNISPSRRICVRSRARCGGCAT